MHNKNLEKKWIFVANCKLFNVVLQEINSSSFGLSASLVKQLKEETGAGMMDCKKALAETEGDLEKAQAYLGEKGLSSADKKFGRLAAKVNCETNFVGRNEKFKELVDDLAMQVVYGPHVQFVSIEDIPEGRNHCDEGKRTSDVERRPCCKTREHIEPGHCCKV